jgi:hypothetical protein
MDIRMEMEGNRFLRRLDRWMAWGLLAALFVYAWFRIGPDLIYFTFGTYSRYPKHEPGWAFFAKTASLSGGLVLYVGGILSQLFVAPWLGAGTMVFTMGLVYAAVRGLPLHWRIAVSVVWRIGFVAAAGWGLRYSHQVNEILEVNPLVLRSGQAVRMGDWQRAVDAAMELKRRGIFFQSVNHDVDRALAQMGQLGDRMFEFPQDLSALLYYHIQDEGSIVWFDKYGGLMFDLGYMNSAEHLTTEILELEGPTPFVLDRLAWIARIKRQDGAARVFETVLSRQIAHRLAQALRPGADGTLNIPDQRLDHLTECMPTQDREVRDTAPDELMLTLLANQPKNRMAFDYLMAYYLLTLQQDKVVSQFYRLKDLGFQRLPRHYAEAALIARDKTRGQIDLQGWQIDPEIEKQYRAITGRARESRLDRRKMAEALAPEFGNSYFFYSMFHASGVGR